MSRWCGRSGWSEACRNEPLSRRRSGPNGGCQRGPHPVTAATLPVMAAIDPLDQSLGARTSCRAATPPRRCSAASRPGRARPDVRTGPCLAVGTRTRGGTRDRFASSGSLRTAFAATTVWSRRASRGTLASANAPVATAPSWPRTVSTSNGIESLRSHARRRHRKVNGLRRDIFPLLLGETGFPVNARQQDLCRILPTCSRPGPHRRGAGMGPASHLQGGGPVRGTGQTAPGDVRTGRGGCALLPFVRALLGGRVPRDAIRPPPRLPEVAGCGWRQVSRPGRIGA